MIKGPPQIILIFPGISSTDGMKFRFSRLLAFETESTKEQVLFKFFIALSSGSFVIVAIMDFGVSVVSIDLFLFF